MMMTGFGMPKSDAADRDRGEFARDADRDREGAVGEADAGEDRADAERRDHRVDADLGDEQAVDAADARCRGRARHRIAIGIGKPWLAIRPQTIRPMKLATKPIAEVELADHQRIGEARGDDRGERRLAEDVEEVRGREECRRRGDREEQRSSQGAR